MKVSVITVSYNAAETIEQALRSVVAQNHGEVEHIIVDGGSVDGSQLIVEELLRPGGRFVSGPDNGIYDAMNKGVALATGDIVGILNADDYLAEPDVLGKVVEAFHRSRSEAVLGDVAFFSAERPGRLFRRYRSGGFRPAHLRWGRMPAHPGMYLTRAAYESVGPYRTDFQIAADYEFMIRAFLINRLSFTCLPELLVHMRAGGVSTSGLSSKLTINREVSRACRDNGIYTNLAMISCKYPLKLMEYLR